MVTKRVSDTRCVCVSGVVALLLVTGGIGYWYFTSTAVVEYYPGLPRQRLPCDCSTCPCPVCGECAFPSEGVFTDCKSNNAIGEDAASSGTLHSIPLLPARFEGRENSMARISFSLQVKHQQDTATEKKKQEHTSFTTIMELLYGRDIWKEGTQEKKGEEKEGEEGEDNHSNYVKSDDELTETARVGLFGRYLMTQISQLHPNFILELGCGKGELVVHLATLLKNNHIDESMAIVCADTFWGANPLDFSGSNKAESGNKAFLRYVLRERVESRIIPLHATPTLAVSAFLQRGIFPQLIFIDTASLVSSSVDLFVTIESAFSTLPKDGILAIGCITKDACADILYMMKILESEHGNMNMEYEEKLFGESSLFATLFRITKQTI
eukprot:m.57995 g.57995  ORF g.57995 m.57995 type:complete len:382 (+) comp7846_c1_seq1:70-1215(+)